MPKIKDEIVVKLIFLIDSREHHIYDEFDKRLDLSKKELFYKMAEEILNRYPEGIIQLMPIEIEADTIPGAYLEVKVFLRALIYDLCITEESCNE